MSLLNKLFQKPKLAIEPEEKKVSEKIVEVPKKAKLVKKTIEFPAPKGPALLSRKRGERGLAFGGKPGNILLSPLATEKAVSGQVLNKYVFKVAAKANKIDIMKAVAKTHNVKVASTNIINIPKKARQVGKTKGFKSGYKKAVVTLAKGQSIEVK